MRIRSLLIILTLLALGLWWALSPPSTGNETQSTDTMVEEIAPAESLAAEDQATASLQREKEEPSAPEVAEAPEEGKADHLGKVVFHFAWTPSMAPMADFPFLITWQSQVRGGPSGRDTGVTNEKGDWEMEVPEGAFWATLQESADGQEKGIRYQVKFESKAGETVPVTHLFEQEYLLNLVFQYPDGQPLANQKIGVWQSITRNRYTFSSRDSGSTDGQGKLAVAMVEGELNVSAEELRSGFFPTTWEIQTSPEMEGSSLTLVPLLAKELLVTVLDSADKPIPEAVISQNHSRERGDVVRRAGLIRGGDQETDAAGQARLTIPWLEEIYLQVRHEGHGPIDVTVPRGQNTLIVRMSSGAKMSGIVLDEDGLPLAEADVYAYAPNDAWASSPDSISGGDWKTMKTDVDGKFHFIGLGTEAMQSILATKEGYAAVFQTWKPKEESYLELVLKPEQPLFGFFLDEADQPIAGASIRILGEPYSEREPAWNNISYLLNDNRQVTDEHGAFAFTNLYMGEYLLQATPTGSVLDSAFVQASPSPTPIILHPGDLAPGFVALRLQVTDAEGNPLAAKANRGYYWIQANGAGGSPGYLIGTMNQEGFGRTEPFDRHMPPMGMRIAEGGERISVISVSQEGFVPEFISVSDLRDGWNDRSVTLQPSGQQEIVLDFGDALLPESPYLKVALACTDILGLQTSGTAYLVPEFATPLHLNSQNKEHSLTFAVWPEAGGELLLWGRQNEGPIRVFVPQSDGSYRIHLSEDQLRTLGLIE